MRISDWSSDVCSSDLVGVRAQPVGAVPLALARDRAGRLGAAVLAPPDARRRTGARTRLAGPGPRMEGARCARATERAGHARRLRDPRRKARLAADPCAPARAPADA